MNKPSRLGFVKKMAAGSPSASASVEEETASSVGVTPTEPTEPTEQAFQIPASMAHPRPVPAAASEPPRERILSVSEPAPDPPMVGYGYASQAGPRPRRTNYVRIHVTMDTTLANFVDVRWRTYRLKNGQLAPNASAYLQDLVARDRAAHPIQE
jgi:hypothetical protein